MSLNGGGLAPEKYEWLQRKLKEFTLSPEQWIALLVSYGVPADRLNGKACECPVCGGTDRFTYDNKRGRGDWVCRHCNNGDVMAGDGLQLITRVNRIGLYRLMRELDGGPGPRPMRTAGSAEVPKPKRKASPEFIAKRLNSMWEAAKPLASGDLAMRYLGTRVPRLCVAPSPALRLGMLEYRHEKKIIGSWPGIIARYELPDGRLGTLHRTFLDRIKPAKAAIVSHEGEILEPKLNDMTLNPLAGGAVRLMDPVNGEIGVAEGLETAYAAFMKFGVPVWYCLNRVLLRQFVVPEGLGIRVVHIFVDFDNVDPKTLKSPGVSDGVELAKRLRADGYTAIIHRPKARGTDFADEWFAQAGNDVPAVPNAPATDLRPLSAIAA
ncbi:primase-helicase zinc-binding domain-containing protein [Paraburkholderia rhizosphaerae]|uniref:Putative DNA primase/helicase n=1 Tax=Paraburkholderia rhizosphaerae TaxID=480658 RepID=A0A4R8LRZ0_9BURK|nr:primase-helicase zinc-binding domain-containing protein [Paraburkholderia rhizosphaerae]TDY48285.1 putative DNA primase/helicase [Paraburkholderia rhizosphaerae]